jgi:hypothetical protein
MNSFRKHDGPHFAESADSSRRSFIRNVGAGVTGALASTAAIAGDGPGKSDSASLQVALLEEEKAIRKLHQAFENAIDKGRHGEVIGLFAEDASVIFNGGVFAGRDQGVSRLFSQNFRATRTGARMEPAPGFELTAEQQQDSVEVAADLLTAKSVFPYSIRVGKPLEASTSHASMARLQGEGVQTWWEGGIYNVAWRKDLGDGRWQISRLEYHALARADYRPGRSWAGPMTVAPLATRFPEDPQGPDALV